MNFIDRIGEGLSSAIDMIVEKNRQCAQLNRLAAIIRNETEVINHAYVALGKQYFGVLEGTEEPTEAEKICEVIKFSEERLKKARARYNYIKEYGVPVSPIDTVDMIRAVNESDADIESFVESPEEDETEENADITIAVAGEDQESAEDSDTGTEKPAEQPQDTHTAVRRKRSRAQDETDTEAANDSENA